MPTPLERLEEQYEIVAKIKEGGMGEIYKVRHRLLDELRVVKVLHAELKGDAELNARFAQEARATIQLRHPNIVQIFDFTLDDAGTGLIVMELIRGVDLKQLIAHHELPSLPLALEIGRQSLRALGFLHKNGFVHRDVSPDNLMLAHDVEGEPLVKLIDLGIAKRHDSEQQLTASGMFLGKFRYASPEHFGARGSAGIEARSDLYTFGLVFYELLTGRYPIPGGSTSQLIAGHLFQPPRDFAETDPEGRLPADLRRLLERTLAKEPEQRYASAEELIDALEGLRRRYPSGAEAAAEARRLTELPVEEGKWEPTVSTHTDLSRKMPALPAAPTVVLGAAPEPSASGEAVEEDPAVAEGARRAEEVEKIVARVEELLASGQLMQADRVLFQAAETLGSPPPLAAVRERLDKLHHRELDSEVRGLVEGADDLAAAGEIERALEVLRKARVLVPAGCELEQTLQRRIRELEHGMVEGDRLRAVARSEREILHLVQRRQLAAAAAALAVAREELGAAEAFDTLRQLIEKTREERLQSLVQQAGVAFEAEDFGRAADLLRQALELRDEDPWIRDRLRRAESELGRQQEERRRAEDSRAFLHQAEEASRAEDYLKARLLVAKAIELAPENAAARALAKRLDRASLDEDSGFGRTEPVPPGLYEVLGDIEALRRQGEVKAAWKRLRAAIEELGEIEPLVGLRKKIADELLGENEALH